MKQRFDYVDLPALPTFADPEPRVFRPVVPITIHGATLSFEEFGMIDTGCAETILPFRLVGDGLIDPDFSAHEEGDIYAFDGTVVHITYGIVDLSIRLKRKTHRWGAIVGFSTARDDVILGDAGFLRYFTVTLNRDELYTTVRPNRNLPSQNWV